jgi:circadian clock protein KaiC
MTHLSASQPTAQSRRTALPASGPLNARRISTGIEGLDAVLNGGYTRNRVYLVEGSPGTGKTTFALRFLLAGVERGDKGLYITLSESADELSDVVQSHGWSLEGIEVFELLDEAGRDPDADQSVLYPSEIELGETVKKITDRITQSEPALIVFDSLSEMRLLAQDPLRYRRQVLALKHFFSQRTCTVLLLDDKTSGDGDLQLHSICHGVITLQQVTRDYGAESRHLRVVKMRGQKFQGGLHDFALDTGRVALFPRLVASAHRAPTDHEQVSSGVPRLDEILGGGLVRGTSTLLLGPSGVGKTSTAVQCMHAALRRGERATYYLFDEGAATLVRRSRSLGMDLEPFIASGQCQVVQIDPADLSTGEFASLVVDAVKRDGASFVALDSLNAYLQAMPGQSYLLLHMHEILTFLAHQGVITMLVVGQHGAVGNVRADIDLSYLSDSTLLFGYFESKGVVKSSITALKSRVAENDRGIREFRLTEQSGVQIGDPLSALEGVLTGLPVYTGSTQMMNSDADQPFGRA